MSKPIFFSFFLFAFINNFIEAENIVFLNDNLKLALKRANAEGKLIFVDFYADYCMPCKLMDEHTFTQEEVGNKLNAGYVPLKVNITSFDGYDLKNQYKVTVLPTMLILDSKGKMIARYEESMGGAALIKILEKFNVPEYKIKNKPVAVSYNKQTSFSNSAPFVSLGSMKPTSENANLKIDDTEPTDYNRMHKIKPITPIDKAASTDEFVERKQKSKYESPAAITEPPLKPIAHSNKTKNQNLADRVPVNNGAQHPESMTAVLSPPKTNVDSRTQKPHVYTNSAPQKTPEQISASSGAPQFVKIRNLTEGFTIKIGAFSTSDNAKKAADAAKLKFPAGKAKIIIQLKQNGSNTLHRVLVGKFMNREEAVSFKQKFQMDGSVVGFSSL